MCGHEILRACIVRIDGVGREEIGVGRRGRIVIEIFILHTQGIPHAEAYREDDTDEIKKIIFGF